MARLIAGNHRIGGMMAASLVLIASIMVSVPAFSATSDDGTVKESAEAPKAVSEKNEPTATAAQADSGDVSKKINCVGGNAPCTESEKVISILKKIAHFYTEGNFEELSKYLAKDVSTFDQTRHKLIEGRQAVISDIKQRWEDAHAKGSPIVSYTIYHPYAKVIGDQAVVTFKAVKTVGGKEPQTLSSRCTDVFIREDGTWKKIHYTSHWKKDKPEPQT